MLLDAVRLLVGDARCLAFDWRHGVHTSGDAKLESLTILGGNARHGVFYNPTRPKLVLEVLESLDIDYGRYHFVDLGSGKGRVLLVASEFPFQEICGVEFARQLHEIACENIRRYRSSSQKCKNVRSIHGDAAAFELPANPLVLYLANPFGPGVLVPVLRNLERSLEQHPRDVILLYTAPFHHELVETETMLRCVERSKYHNAYRTQPSPRDAA